VGLVERETFLDSLTSYADEALLGQGRVVLVAGEAGVGKTALLEAFQERMPGATWAWGACDGLSTPRPLAPLYDVARALGGALQAAVRAGAAREELFDVFVSRLVGGADLTVVVIEDLHWADEASLDLIRHLARRLTSARALMLLTYRDDSLAGDALLRTALGDLSSYRGTRRMALPPLTEQAVARLAAGSAFSPEELHRLTAGNPYFLSEVLAGHGEQVPPSVRDAVLARAARLDPSARGALDVVALVGARQDPALLRSLPEVTGEALDACVGSGLLVSLGTSLDFRHDLARLAVAAAVPMHRRIEIHARVLAALLQAGVDDQAQLAHHAEGAQEVAAVLEHAPAAARAASAVASHREAAAQYARAIRHADQLPARERAFLYESFAAETSLVDRWDEVVEAREKALALWRELNDDLQVGNALRQLVSPYWRLCRGPDSDRVAFEAIEVLERLPWGPELARAWAIGAAVHAEHDTAEAIRLLGLAKDLARDLGLVDCLSDVLNTEACVRLQRGEESEALFRESLAIAEAAGLEAQVSRAHANLYADLTTCWRLESAEQLFDQAITYTDTHDLATYGTCLRGQRSWSLRQQGRTREAMAVTAGLLAEGLPSQVNSLNPLSSHGLLAARTGDRDASRQALDEVLGFSLDLGEDAWTRLVRCARAEAAWIEGRDRDAADEIAFTLAHRAALNPWELGEVFVWARRMRLELPTPETRTLADPWAAELAGEHRAAAQEWDRLGGHYLAAMALAFSDREQDLREALDRFTELEAPAVAVRVRQVLRERGADAVPAGPRASTRAHPAGLTRRESEVLNGLARGLTNADLAAELYLSERTVEHHVSSVLGKLQVGSRAEAAREAERRGLLAVAT
jgi:DNA-binding NarL/FixJ family response regulator